jgi:hypothetical protein
MADETEMIRREMVAEINADVAVRTSNPNTARFGAHRNLPRTSRYWALPPLWLSCVGGRTECGDR